MINENMLSNIKTFYQAEIAILDNFKCFSKAAVKRYEQKMASIKVRDYYRKKGQRIND